MLTRVDDTYRIADCSSTELTRDKDDDLGVAVDAQSETLALFNTPPQGKCSAKVRSDVTARARQLT